MNRLKDSTSSVFAAHARTPSIGNLGVKSISIKHCAVRNKPIPSIVSQRVSLVSVMRMKASKMPDTAEIINRDRVRQVEPKNAQMWMTSTAGNA